MTRSPDDFKRALEYLYRANSAHDNQIRYIRALVFAACRLLEGRGMPTDPSSRFWLQDPSATQYPESRSSPPQEKTQ